MMFHTFGRPVVSVTSRVVKTDVTWNLSQFSDGSGQRTVKRWHQPTRLQSDGDTIHGLKLDTKNKDNQTMPSLTSTVPQNLVFLFSIMYTMMVSPGTMLPVITKNHLFAKILKSFSITSPVPIGESDFNYLIIFFNYFTCCLSLLKNFIQNKVFLHF